MPELTRNMLDGLPQNGPTDPIEYYRKPLTGWLFRERINMGLRLLGSRRYPRVLEVGYSAGAVLLTLADISDDLHGIDLDAAPAPVERMLAARGRTAKLLKGNVYDLPYEPGAFDLVVCFSVFEHLHEPDKALREVARVLAPGGDFLLGMPAVNRMMEVGFRAIGFKGIEDHHVTAPRRVASGFPGAGLSVRASRTLDFPVKWLRLYHTWLLATPARV